MKTIHALQARPFIKWVGGKTQLLKDIEGMLPSNISTWENATYVEPFVGGGAVLFWILQKFPNIKTAIINDINVELICTYRVIQSDVENLIAELKKMESEYLSYNDAGRKEYYLVKRKLYNSKSCSQVLTAALFIFLNRTCFNGLYRVNSKGEFNVPHGRYVNPKICDEELLYLDSTILQRVKILCGDFSQTGQYADSNTIYYFDPPYRPLSETSSFTSYSKGGFDDDEQKRLRDFCEEIASKNAHFIASNSDPLNINDDDRFFDDLYERFLIKRVNAARMINSKGDRRGPVSEIIISNNLSFL